MSTSSRQPDTLHAPRLANWLALLALLAAGIVWAPADGATPWGGWNVSRSAGAGSGAIR